MINKNQRTSPVGAGSAENKGEGEQETNTAGGCELKRSATICIKSRRKSKAHPLPTIDQSITADQSVELLNKPDVQLDGKLVSLES